MKLDFFFFCNRWRNVSPVGQPIPGTRFIAFKVPLKGVCITVFHLPTFLLSQNSKDGLHLGSSLLFNIGQHHLNQFGPPTLSRQRRQAKTGCVTFLSTEVNSSLMDGGDHENDTKGINPSPDWLYVSITITSGDPLKDFHNV